MEFLKAILGEELYAQFEQAINAYNGNEANKDKQVKLGNLATGEYVSKGKHDSEVERLNALLTGKDADIQTLTATLESLKKDKVDADVIQTKLKEMESEYALRDALREAKAVDVDWMSFSVNKKLNEEGKTIELDGNKKIKGWEDILAALKTKFPTQFESTGQKNIIENRLRGGDGSPMTVTKEQFRGMNYEDRLALKKNNEALYKEYTKN